MKEKEKLKRKGKQTVTTVFKQKLDFKRLCYKFYHKTPKKKRV